MTPAETSHTRNSLDLEARLLSRFSRLHPEDVRRCLRDSAAQFDDARVRTFLAVLIERAATDRLREMERAMGEIDASSEVNSCRVAATSAPIEMSRERDNGEVVRTRRRVVPAVG